MTQQIRFIGLAALSASAFGLAACSSAPKPPPTPIYNVGPADGPPGAGELVGLMPNFATAVPTFRETLAALVAADTTSPPGNESRAVAILAARLKAAGVPYEILDFAPGRQNLVARLKGTGKKKPLLLIAHLDVVGVDNQAWATPPHQLTEKDGFLYGRGVWDDLGMAVANLEVFIQFHRIPVPLNRDLILAFTGDEESGGAGVRDILAKRPELLDAEIALNEGGQAVLNEDGKLQYVKLQAAEKTYQDFELSATGPTGHSSVPRKGNAIEKLAKALARLAAAPDRPRLLPVTRAYFAARAPLEKPEVASAMQRLAASQNPLPKDALAIVDKTPETAALLRTTCTMTTIQGGTRVNSLPAQAKANVNCRILPDESPAETQARLTKIIADREIQVKPSVEMGSSPPSPVEGEFVDAIKRATASMYPGLPIIPALAGGATDSRFLRAKGVKAYGLDPMPMTERDGARAHGIDERLRIASIQPGMQYLYRLVHEIAK